MEEGEAASLLGSLGKLYFPQYRIYSMRYRWWGLFIRGEILRPLVGSVTQNIVIRNKEIGCIIYTIHEKKVLFLSKKYLEYFAFYLPAM
jgi:hypothetical protein